MSAEHKNKPCCVENCSGRNYGNGYCNKHYQQIRKYGEIKKFTRKTFNEVIERKNYYKIVLNDKEGNIVGYVKIDKEDLTKIKKYGRWSINTNGYDRWEGPDKQRELMHRVIMNAPPDKDVDHVKRGIKYRLDNRKKNLRICSTQENCFNKDKHKNNKSGYKGVHYNGNNKWRAAITIKGKTRYIGLYPTPKEAYKAYCIEAKTLHKEFYFKNKRSSK